MFLGIIFHPKQRDCLARQITGMGSAIFAVFCRIIGSRYSLPSASRTNEKGEDGKHEWTVMTDDSR
jgi:hypothetical protein